MNKGNIFRVASTTDSVSEYFNSRDSAINFIIDDDMSRYGENPKVISEVTPNSYDRWFDNENYCVEHLKVELIEFVPNKGVSIFSKK